MYTKEGKSIQLKEVGAAKKSFAGDFVVGIDTGGTYTDGVLMDYRTRRVVASGKTLTTRANLAEGVITVLKMLEIKNPANVKLVGISSTLATNSIAEGKAREVGLALIGYDPELISSYGLDANFATRYFAYFEGGHNSQGAENAPLDLEGIKAWVREHQDKVDAFAVSSYFSPLNPSHEEAVFAAIREICEVPVVLGHQLSTQIDSIKRATTACLNASLVAVMQEFIAAVQESLEDQEIHAPLMIVKGDGSLMPHAEAAEKPVETILSGPAASAIGGLFFSRHGNALMIDVGGTTTDMALIQDSQMTITDEGARVGEIKTAVKAARIRTACVGCDSRISFAQGGRAQVGPDRVVPLCRLASQYPSVKKTIAGLKRKDPSTWTQNDLDYWFLHKPMDPEACGITDPQHAELIRFLNESPRSLTEILKAMGVYHAVQLQGDPLIRQGLIEQATLTPSDLLHVNGQMDVWDVDAARQAMECACHIYGRNPKHFVSETLEMIVATMVEEAIIFLASQEDEVDLPEIVDGDWGRWMVDEAISGSNEYVSVNVASRFPVIGIGAPAGIFVKKVAETLKAPFILPDHAHVANAAGAVAGSVMADKEALVYVQEVDGAHAHIVQIGDERNSFSEYEEAFAYAKAKVKELAVESASSSGAVSPQASVKVKTDGAIERVQARAVGNPRLSEQWGTLPR
ncbi:MAG TPA: hydantoinase/oxoprolinase family protein [Desulfosalsimonadaceae bacterium]|nr:hydantoinase/oxoprolinase family protein [Desulfosalsimonadaceae bacterium]